MLRALPTTQRRLRPRPRTIGGCKRHVRSPTRNPVAKYGDGTYGCDHHTGPLRYRSYAGSRRVRPSRSGEQAEPQKNPSRESTARQLYQANILAPPARAKLSDYIEVILHCKAAASAPTRLLRFEMHTSCSALLRTFQGIASIVTVTPLFQRTGTTHVSFVSIVRVCCSRERQRRL